MKSIFFIFILVLRHEYTLGLEIIGHTKTRRERRFGVTHKNLAIIDGAVQNEEKEW